VDRAETPRRDHDEVPIRDKSRMSMKENVEDDMSRVVAEAGT
jgi:hypothetical protein